MASRDSKEPQDLRISAPASGGGCLESTADRLSVGFEAVSRTVARARDVAAGGRRCNQALPRRIAGCPARATDHAVIRRLLYAPITARCSLGGRGAAGDRPHDTMDAPPARAWACRDNATGRRDSHKHVAGSSGRSTRCRSFQSVAVIGRASGGRRCRVPRAGRTPMCSLRARFRPRAAQSRPRQIQKLYGVSLEAGVNG